MSTIFDDIRKIRELAQSILDKGEVPPVRNRVERLMDDKPSESGHALSTDHYPRKD
jgi:hypothetical protein